MKKNFALLLVMITTVCGCVKWNLDKVEKLAIISTLSVSNISYSGASISSEITFDGGTAVTRRGVCWSSNQNPTVGDNLSDDGNGSGSFTSNLSDLEGNTTYYVRAYASNSAGTAYGNQLSFTTPAGPTIPVLSTTTISSITQTTANGGGSISSDGGFPVSARGVCWSTNENPSLSDSHTSNGTGPGSFTSTITGLTVNTAYFVRAYATNSLGTAYGNQIVFTTSEPTIPELTTSTITNIAQSTANAGGTITSDGGANVSARGICWSTNQNPTLTDNQTSNGSGIGGYTSSITGLTASTTYYVRAYATNSLGTAYGNELSFTTLAPPTIPTVTTTPITNINSTTASGGGTINSDGGASILTRGVCWSTSQTPTIADSYTSNGVGAGSFNSSITSLAINTTYYVRAYATNSVGIAYGNEISFTTTCNPPTVVIQSADYVFSNYNQTLQVNFYTTNLCGIVTNDGGGAITGVNVWFNQSNPPNGGGGASYGGLNTPFCISPLTQAGTYYLRVSATSGCGGTGYSNIQQIILP
jgi:hypothetical protein